MRTRISRLLILSALAAALPACSDMNLFSGQRPGGRMASFDMYTYESTNFTPQTVKLIDLRDEQELWSVDVPVGYKLVVRFYNSPNAGDAYMTDEMRWVIVKSGTGPRTLSNQIPCPPVAARRLDVELRSAPERSPDAEPVAPLATN